MAAGGDEAPPPPPRRPFTVTHVAYCGWATYDVGMVDTFLSKASPANASGNRECGAHLADPLDDRARRWIM